VNYYSAFSRFRYVYAAKITSSTTDRHLYWPISRYDAARCNV